MPRKKATPAHLADLLSRHRDTLAWIDESLAAKARLPLENQAEHIKRPVEYWEGMAYGANNMVEQALMSYGCYRGFSYVGPRVTLDGKLHSPWVALNNPDFKEWRRSYHEG